MNVSHFELVYKPQAPAGPADVVTQGYFLEITNLEDNELQFQMTLTTSTITDPDRSLVGNTAVFVDTPGTNNNIGTFSLIADAAESTFRLDRRIVVPAKGTALVAVLPSDPFPPSSVPGAAADFECRGFVQLTLPVIFVPGQMGPFLGRFKEQEPNPAKVLLTAQNRAVYTDQATGNAKGQTQGSLPLASGKSENEIVPQPLFRPVIDKLDLNQVVQMLSSGVDFQDGLAGMLAVAQNSEMDLKSFNAALKKSGVGMAVETRKT